MLTMTGVGLACCLLAAGCGSAQPAGTVTGNTTAKPAASVPASASSQPQSAHRMIKILVIMEENHSVGQVFPSHMPYLWSLASRYGRATAWSDVGHPSLPNYLAIFGGSSFGDPQDCLPGPGCSYPGPTVFHQSLYLESVAVEIEGRQDP
jgi:acid phosphatase